MMGSKGGVGEKGDMGTTGVTGPQGSRGLTGPTGPEFSGESLYSKIVFYLRLTSPSMHTPFN